VAEWIIADDGIYEAEGLRKILDVRLEFSDVGQSSDGHTATATWLTSGGRKNVRRLPLTMLGDKSKLRDWLYANAIIPTATVEAVMAYGKDKIRDLLTQSDPIALSKSFGWRSESAFVLGNREIHANSTNASRLDDGIPADTIAQLNPRGSIDQWIAATEILEHPGYRAHAFILLASLAAPILDIMGVQGCVLSLAGPAGTGKTSAMNFGLSVYGHPNALVIAPESTTNARSSKLSQAKNIPIGIDDLSAHMREINGMMYMVANGRAKSRSNMHGDVREAASFCTVMMITTNYPMMDLTRRELGEAERRRLVEIPIRVPMERPDVVRLNHTMQENYGVVALPYIQYLVRNRATIKDQALKSWQNICENTSIPDASRFGTWLLAAAETAGNIAQGLGIIKFDPAPVLKFAIAETDSHSESIEAEVLEVEEVDEMVFDYVMRHHDQISIKIGTKVYGHPGDSKEFLGSFLADKRELRLRTKPLRKYLVSKLGISTGDWRTWARHQYGGMSLDHATSKLYHCTYKRDVALLEVEKKENEDGYRILRKTAESAT